MALARAPSGYLRSTATLQAVRAFSRQLKVASQAACHHAGGGGLVTRNASLPECHLAACELSPRGLSSGRDHRGGNGAAARLVLNGPRRPCSSGISSLLPPPPSLPRANILLQGKRRVHRQVAVGPRASYTAAATAARDSNTELLVQHLLVPGDQLQLLLELQKRIIQEGHDLSDLAAEFSICPSKSEGGMIGWISRGRTVAEFEDAAFRAPLNKLVRAKTKYGWHLLQVLAEREAAVLEQIRAEDLAKRMQEAGEGELQLIDVREPSEIEMASVPGFKAYPLGQFGKWAPTIAQDLDTAKETFVMCHHGVRSQQAAEWLKSQGFKRLYNVVGGIDAYSRSVDPAVPTY